jgi:hypothetical protein
MEKLKGSARAVALAQIVATCDSGSPFSHPFFGPSSWSSFDYGISRRSVRDHYSSLEKADALLTQAEEYVDRKENKVPVIDFQTERKHEL